MSGLSEPWLSPKVFSRRFGKLSGDSWVHQINQASSDLLLLLDDRRFCCFRSFVSLQNNAYFSFFGKNLVKDSEEIFCDYCDIKQFLQKMTTQSSLDSLWNNLEFFRIFKWLRPLVFSEKQWFEHWRLIFTEPKKTQCSEQSPPGKFFEVYQLDQSMRHGHTNWIIQLREESWGRMVCH